MQCSTQTRRDFRQCAEHGSRSRSLSTQPRGVLKDLRAQWQDRFGPKASRNQVNDQLKSLLVTVGDTMLMATDDT